MFTYFLMGLPFIGVVLAMDMFVLKTKIILRRPTWIVMAVMICVTAVFDQLLTGLPIVHYNEAHISGARLLYAPVEDFMYTVAAVIGIGSLITYVEKNKT